MNREDEVCKCCLYNEDGKKKCKNKSMIQKGEIQVCENFTFVFASNIPYDIIYKLLGSENFYKDFSDILSLMIIMMLNKSLFKLKVNIENKKVSLYAPINNFDYGDFDLQSITLTDKKCILEIDPIFKSVLTGALSAENSMLLLEFEDYSKKEDYYHLVSSYSLGTNKNILPIRKDGAILLNLNYETLNIDEAFINLEESE